MGIPQAAKKMRWLYYIQINGGNLITEKERLLLSTHPPLKQKPLVISRGFCSLFCYTISAKAGASEKQQNKN